jgi:anti-sigma regulatory factor (Ser/Thr protein kinase)
MKTMNRLRMEETSQVAEARRMSAGFCRSLGFDETLAGRVSIVVTELATNLVKHAGGGELILRSRNDADTPALEILSLDKGPGIKNIGESLRDGHSTTGSPGTGLGAIFRLSSLFELYSIPGRGSAVLSRIRRHPSFEPLPPPTQTLESGVICLPIESEEVCGDAWAIHQTNARALIMVADGLGHGGYAAEASQAAVRVFENHIDSGPAAMIERMHAALRGTRGAAVAVTEIDRRRRMVRHAGAGNICGRILSGEADRGMVSSNGTVGLEISRIQEFIYPWPDNGLLILHSDGLSSRWGLKDHPGLAQRHPALIAGVLFRDHRRIRDDNAVVVITEPRRSA